ncbi:putative SIS domain protein [uncultured delta proteobacterium]|uniref:Putative SIS domain protein n=1 Tax=uncultured delta proteobacterium TaxID=34034 RepID=A0A212JAM6_9DELT|nr:putative SIS domain protein [uncultured delta proteobacterium]
MHQGLEDAIRHAKLTKLEKTIAEYVLRNIGEVSFMTVAELAKALDVSDTSIIRATRAMGYAGFSDFQRSIQQELRQKMQDLDNPMSPKGRFLSKSARRDKENLTAQGLSLVMGHLNAVMENNSREKLEKTIDILVGSRQKFICGYRGSAAVLYFFGQKLRQFLPMVHTLITGDSEMIERLADISSKDCLFVCSFPRYNHMVMQASDMARRAGAKVIALTDKVTSPLARNTEISLLAGVDFPGFCNSYVAPLFICDLLLLLLSEKINMESNGKADLIEEYVQKLNINYL